MSTVFIVSLVLFFLALVTGIIFFIDTYHLCKKVVPKIDEIIYGHPLMFDSWLMLIMRLQEYTAWSTFYEYLPKLAAKRGWTDKAARIPPKVRRRLIIASLEPLIGVLIIIALEILGYFYPDMGLKHRLPPS